MSKIKDVTKLNDDIDLYIREDTAKPTWNCRYYIGDKRVRKSCKTTDKAKAQQFALNAYFEDKKNHEEGEPIKPDSFKAIATSYKNYFVRLGKSKDQTQTYKNSIEKKLIPYFGKIMIDKIKLVDIEYFVDELLKQDLKPSTINSHLTVFRQVMKYANKKGFISRDKIPYMENIPLQADRKRETFEIHEIRRLLRYIELTFKEEINYAEVRINKTHHKNKMVSQEPLYWLNDKTCRKKFFNLCFLKLMISTGARPSTLIKINFGHITSYTPSDQAKGLEWELPEHEAEDAERDEGKPKGPTYLYLTGMKSNKGKSGFYGDIVPNRLGQSVLWELLEYKRVFDIPDSEQVFTNRTAAYADVLDRVLIKMGLRMSKNNKPRTLYSLRHFYITDSLEKGVPTSLVASNSFTSIEMIEKHYAHVSTKRNISQLATT
jgi:integrase